MRAQTVFFRLPRLPLPRHPLLRMLVLAAGAILLAGLIAMSLIVGTAVLAAAATWLLVRRWVGRRKRDRGDPSVIEGEFTVVPRNSLPRSD